MSPLHVGVDVGGTQVKAGLVDDRGQVVATARRDTPGRSVPVRRVEDTVVAVVTELLARADGLALGVGAVGVAAAGLVDAARGTVVFAPHLPWRGEPLGERLSGRLGLPVAVDNDANAAAWAEHRFGAGRGESHLLVLTLGTGIGGAVITRGRLERGRHGLAGELGHVQVVPDGTACPCGHRGCWEQYVSGTALRRAAQEVVRRREPGSEALADACAGDPARLRGEDVSRLARAGDRTSRVLLAEAGRWLGVGLAGAVAVLDPGMVVVGGGLAGAGDLLLDPAREAMADRLPGHGHRPEVPVLPARLGELAGLVGAADLARAR